MPMTAATRLYVDEFLAIGEKADTIRTIWYQIKHKMQPFQGSRTEKEFSDYICVLIGTHLWHKFLDGDVGIYERLGIVSKVLEKRELPIILFCEKQLSDFHFINSEIEGSVYLSSGQTPNFEIAELARLLQHEKDVYLLSMGDFDPAGFDIQDQLASKLQQALNAFANGTQLHYARVVFRDPLNRYETYTLAMEQQSKWTHGSEGVELDTIPKKDRIESIKFGLEALLPLEIFKSLALKRKRTVQYHRRLKESVEHKKLKRKVEELEKMIWEEVGSLPYTFQTERFEEYRPGEVAKMVELDLGKYSKTLNKS